MKKNQHFGEKPSIQSEQREAGDSFKKDSEELELNENVYDIVGREIADCLVRAGKTEALRNIANENAFFDQSIFNLLLEQGFDDWAGTHLDLFKNLDFEKVHRAGIDLEFMTGNLDSFVNIELNGKTAIDLIERGCSANVAQNLEKFSGLDYNAIAQKLIEKDDVPSLVDNLNKFENLSSDVFVGLIEGNSLHSAIKYISKFPRLDIKVASYLHNFGKTEVFAENLHLFNDLSESYAELLIRFDWSGKLLSNLERFNKDELPRIILRIARSGLIGGLVDKFPQYGAADVKIMVSTLAEHKRLSIESINSIINQNILNRNEFALLLIRSGYLRIVLDSFHKFNILNREVFAELISFGAGENALKNLAYFQDIDSNEAALKFIARGEIRVVAEHIELFHDLNEAVAYNLIERGRSDIVLKYLNRFQGINGDELREYIDKRNTGDVSAIFKNFDQAFALGLVDSGEGAKVFDQLEKFSSLDMHELALHLSDSRQSGLIIDNLPKFRGVLDAEVARRMIISGHGDFVIKQRKKFNALGNGLGDNALAQALIEADQLSDIIRNIESLKSLDNSVAIKLCEADYQQAVMENIGKFRNIGSDLAITLIDRLHQLDGFFDNIDKFSGLNQEAALRIIHRRYGHSLLENIEKFQDLDDNEIIEQLVRFGLENLTIASLHKFKNADLQTVAEMLVESGDTYFLFNYLEKFSGLDPVRIICLSIESDDDDDSNKELAEHFLNNSSGLDYEFIALRLIETGHPGFVANYFDNFPGLDHTRYAAKLIDSDCSDELMRNIDKFHGFNQSKIADKLMQKGMGGAIAYNLDVFPDLDHKDLAMRLVRNRDGNAVASRIDLFRGVDRKAIAEEIIRVGDGECITYNLENFPELDHKKLMNDLIDAGTVTGVAAVSRFHRFKGIDKNELLDSLVKTEKYYLVAEFLAQFSNELDISIAKKLIKLSFRPRVAEHLGAFQILDEEVAYELLFSGYNRLVANKLDKFRNLSSSIAANLIARGHADQVINNTESFQALDIDLLDRMIDAGSIKQAGLFERILADRGASVNVEEINHKLFFIIERNLFPGSINVVIDIMNNFPRLAKFDKMKDLRERFIACVSELLDKKDIASITALKDIKGLPFDKDFEYAFDIFGSFLTAGIYREVISLRKGEISETMSKLGVTKSGDDGILQLRQAIGRMKRSFRSPDFQGENLDNEIAASFFKKFARYEESQYGNHDDGRFKRTVESHRAYRLSGEIADLPEAYAESPVMSIAKVDRVQQITYEYSEPFRMRFAVLGQSLEKALDLVNEDKPLSALLEEASQIRTELLVPLKEKLKDDNIIKNDKARKSLENRIFALESADLRSIADFEQNFSLLADFKEFHDLLRKGIFFLVLHAKRDARGGVTENFNVDSPTLENISWALQFIDQATNNETKNRYFKDEKAKNAFLKITSARALAEELSKVQSQDEQGMAKMKFIPTRGLLMEFSGHIADACWASKEDSLAKNHPNKMSVTMVQSPDTPTERLAGACILIETKSSEGEDLLVIRGLNPIENVINQLSVEDFYKKITSYLKTVAKKANRKLAIVVDDHRGGSASNRQVLFDYLRHNCCSTKVKLASDTDTRFNGYIIINDCYLVE